MSEFAQLAIASRTAVPQKTRKVDVDIELSCEGPQGDAMPKPAASLAD
jgi:hypothetical protein